MNEVGLPKDELETPALWVDLVQMEENIEQLAAHYRAAGVQWRPHVKAIRVPAIAQKALDAGAIGVTCATVHEAEVMAAAGIDHILIANQVVGADKVTRLASLAGARDVKVAVDDADNVRELGAAATAREVEIGVLVELDVGMQRAGVQPGEPAVALSRLVQETPGLRYDGLMGWEGHTVSITEASARAKAVREAAGLLRQTVEQCRAAGLPVRIVSGGGSATAAEISEQSVLTESQAGGAILGDVYYRARHRIAAPALFVRSTVTSRPAPERLIFDAGFKALPAWKEAPRPVDLPPLASYRPSAAHGTAILQAPDESIAVGEAFDFAVGYADQTTFLYERLCGVRDGVVVVIWEIW